MTVAYVGLGANLGEPRRHLESALEELDALPRTRVTARSAVYRSAPLGYAGQPDFLNAVAAIDTALRPEKLLNSLQEIEIRHKRDRPFPGAPRTLDLDLLLYGDAEIDTPQLQLPHPRMHERAFVLAPLVAIAPEISIPGHGPARELLAACHDQKVERIS